MWLVPVSALLADDITVSANTGPYPVPLGGVLPPPLKLLRLPELPIKTKKKSKK